VNPSGAIRARGEDTRWLLLFCLARIGFSFIFTSYAAAMPLLTRDWAMSASQAGMVQSAWHLGYLVSLFGVGFLADRHGAKRTFLWSAAAAGGSALLFALQASGFRSGLLLHGFAGLCSGGSYTPGLTLIAERFPPATRGRAMGAYLAAGSLGYALSILASSRLFPLGGWRLAFLVTGSLPAFGLALSLWVLRATPNRVLGPPATARGMGRCIAQVLRNRPALLSMLAYTFHCWELLGMWAWLPAYLTRAALSAPGGAGAAALERAVLLSGLTYLTSMAGSILGGSLSDRWGRCRAMLFFSLTSLVFSFTFGWMLGAPLVLIFAAAAGYNLAAIADSSIYSTALTELVDPRHIGAAYAVRSVMGFGAGVVSPWLFGLVIDLVRGAPPGSERLAWGLAWTCLGLGALPGPWAIWRLHRRPEARRMGMGRG
jgi:MFS family permease